MQAIMTGRTKETTLPASLAVLGTVLMFAGWVAESGLMFFGFVTLLAAGFTYSAYRNRRVAAEHAAQVLEAETQRQAALTHKFGPEVAARILAREVWQGATAEMVSLAIGNPVDVDEKVLKTKTKQTWKYDQRGANSFGCRVFFENGVVVGWERK